MSYAASESLIARAGEGRIYAASTWATRVNSNIGCYDDGIRAALFDGVSWTDLGELKVDRRRSEWSSCPLALVVDVSLVADDGGGARIAFLEIDGRERQGHVYVFAWTGDAWEREESIPVQGAWDVSLSAVAPGTLWLSWTARDEDGSRFVLQRLHGGRWEPFDALRSPEPDLRGSIVCADDSGNPVIALTHARGGEVLYRRP